jgi:ATP-binding protein involved in chromosome partitioning
MTDTAAVLEAAGAVEDPELELGLGVLGMIADATLEGSTASVTIALPMAAWPTQGTLLDNVKTAVSGLDGVSSVSVSKRTMSEDERLGLRTTLRGLMGAEPEQQGLHQHSHGDAPPKFLATSAKTRVLGISSGKGGVGKSSVTVNLAIALAKAGKRVGILDADVYGFSVPKMLGPDHDPIILGDTVIPTAVHGVRCLSMGFFVPDEQPVIWRGPMLHKAIEQFVTEAWWGEPDFLLIDMPPGTGDVALTLSEVLPRIEIYVVTTPQSAAQRVAQRSAWAARKMKLAVRGVIENMSWFTGDDNKRYELFGAGGGTELAGQLGVPMLGQVPFTPALREGGDEGSPITVSDPTSEASQAFEALATKIIAQGPARVYRQELKLGG